MPTPEATYLQVRDRLFRVDPNDLYAQVDHDGENWLLKVTVPNGDFEEVPFPSEADALDVLDQIGQHFGAIKIEPRTKVAETTTPETISQDERKNLLDLPVASHVLWTGPSRTSVGFFNRLSQWCTYMYDDLFLRRKVAWEENRQGANVSFNGLLYLVSEGVATELILIAFGAMQPAPAKEDSK